MGCLLKPALFASSGRNREYMAGVGCNPERTQFGTCEWSLTIAASCTARNLPLLLMEGKLDD
jgi:hypothetical protein